MLLPLPYFETEPQHSNECLCGQSLFDAQLAAPPAGIKAAVPQGFPNLSKPQILFQIWNEMTPA